MRSTARFIALFALLVAAVGVCIYAWSAGFAANTPDPGKLAEQRRIEEEQAQVQWRESLTWTKWESRKGVRVRAGLPAKIEIGVMFDVAIELESVPEQAAAEERWLFGGSPPGVQLRFFDEQGERYEQIREWTGDAPPDTDAAFDLTKPNQAFLRRRVVVPSVKNGVQPGPTNVSVRVGRKPSSVKTDDPEDVWTGHIETQMLPVEVVAGSMETRMYFLPVRLRLVERQWEAVDPGGQPTTTRMVRVTYFKSDAEKIMLTYPKGAQLHSTFSCSETPGMAGAVGGARSGCFEPNDNNGIEKWFNPTGPIEKTYNLAVTYTLPVPTEEGAPEPTVLWSKTLSVKYEPERQAD